MQEEVDDSYELSMEEWIADREKYAKCTTHDFRYIRMLGKDQTDITIETPTGKFYFTVFLKDGIPAVLGFKKEED